ncbi:MAG: bifunctional adenosylcobinamide kinase/adenosylcobinamide-phosphate guanylyltransferase [Pseudomonadales bacterium]|nr:bifunctional adenosylcobinamide kinase/adenosylcobinamide-phosphate guanylyltransferase [Pseudomonadales bacterium]
MVHLILGGARSGKSKLAESLAATTNLPVTYIATATAGDQEMQSRITHHQQQRPSSWNLIEEPLDLAKAIKSCGEGPRCILVDCLTLWVSNLLMKQDPNVFDAAKESFLKTLEESQQSIILVSNETGMGVIPMGEITRQFVDESGRLHQAIGEIADNVTLTMAGLPMPLKAQGKNCYSIT